MSTLSTNLGTFITLRVAFSTPTTRVTGRIVRVIAPPARTDSHRDTLYHASVVVTSGVHAVVDGEVAADQVRAHCSIFLGQGLRLVNGVGLILAVIDADNASVS